MWHTAPILWATGSSTLFVPYKTHSLGLKWHFSSRKLTVVSPSSFKWIKKSSLLCSFSQGLLGCLCMQVLNAWNFSFLLLKVFPPFPTKRQALSNNNNNVIPGAHYKILLKKKNPGIFTCLSCWRQPSICNFSWNDNPNPGIKNQCLSFYNTSDLFFSIYASDSFEELLPYLR